MFLTVAFLTAASTFLFMYYGTNINNNQQNPSNELKFQLKTAKAEIVLLRNRVKQLQREKDANFEGEYIRKNEILYFEVHVKELSGPMWIGFFGDQFPSDDQIVGHYAGSVSVSNEGVFTSSGNHDVVYDRPGGFNQGDVIGCGIMFQPVEERYFFFTKNAQMWGKPIRLAPDEEIKGGRYQIPSVSQSHGSSVDFNYGNDPNKPYNYSVKTHPSHLVIDD